MNLVGTGILGIPDISLRATLGILLDTTGGEVSDSSPTDLQEKLASLLNDIQRGREPGGMKPARLKRDVEKWVRTTGPLNRFASTESLMAQVRETLTPGKKQRIVVQPLKESESDLTPRVRLALERMIERLWALRIYRGVGGHDEGRWFEKILASKFLDSPEIQFRFQTLKRGGESYLFARWVPAEEGRGIPEIYFREDLPLDEKDLAFVLLSALMRKALKWAGAAKLKKGVVIGGLDFVRNTMDSKRQPSFIPMAVQVQRKLIAEGSPLRFTLGHIPPGKDPLVPRFLREPSILHLQLPEKELASLTPAKLMDWFAEAPSKSTGRGFIPFSLRDLDETLSFKINDKATPPSHPQIPKAWVRELFDLLRWIKNLTKQPNVVDMDTIIFQVDFVLIPSPQRKSSRVAIGGSPYGIHVTVYCPYEELVGLSPLGWLEVLLFKEQSARHIFGYGTRRKFSSVETLSEIRSSTQTSQQWAKNWVWVQLLWDYKKFLSARVTSKKQEGNRLTMRGEAWEKDKGAQNKLMKAIMRLKSREERLVTDSVAARPIWFLEYPNLEDPSPAQKVSVWVTDKSKLIHFDGKPQFSDEEWEKIAELILKAPEGLTWVEPPYSCRSNRPELLAKEGDEAWYEQNLKYKSAPTRKEKEGYQRALGLIGELARRANLTPPKPTSSLEEIKSLKRRLTRKYHPDARQLTLSTEDFTQMMNAFSILFHFHPKEE